MSDSRLAIYGAGHLATALIEGFSLGQPEPISLYNRSPQRPAELARAFPNIKVFTGEAAFDSEKCPLLLVIPGPAFLQVSPSRIQRLRESGRVIVSCINGLPLAALERRFPGIPWIKAIPNVAAAIGRSVTLIAKGTSVGDADLDSVEQIFKRVGTVFRAQSDEELDRFAVVTSCLPGMLGAILDEFAQAFGLNERQTRELLIPSAAGSLALVERDAAGLKHLVASVSNPGGLTQVGVSTIRSELPPVLDLLRQALDRKRDSRSRQYLAID